MAIAQVKTTQTREITCGSNNGCPVAYSYRKDPGGFVEEKRDKAGDRHPDPIPGADYGQPRRRKRGARFTPQEFWQHVVTGPSCWMWQGTVHARNGYGAFWYPPQQQTMCAHRIAWLLSHGDIPEGVHVLHNCPDGDDPRCCNPAHLWLGTQLDNMRDMAAKGRRSPDCHTPKGHKWTPEHRANMTAARKRKARKVRVA